MTNFFDNPYEKPVDPGYQRFEKGWNENVSQGWTRFPNIRWHPRTTAWYHYPLPRWEMIDRGIPDLKPPATVLGFTLPALFREVEAVPPKFSKYPDLVWNPYNGSWRESRDSERGKPPVVDKPSPDHSADAAIARALADRDRELNAAYGEYAGKVIDIGTLNVRLTSIREKYRPILGDK